MMIPHDFEPTQETIKPHPTGCKHHRKRDNLSFCHRHSDWILTTPFHQSRLQWMIQWINWMKSHEKPALRLAAAACCSSEADLEGRLDLAVENPTSQKDGDTDDIWWVFHKWGYPHSWMVYMENPSMNG